VIFLNKNPVPQTSITEQLATKGMLSALNGTYGSLEANVGRGSDLRFMLIYRAEILKFTLQ
jgi:hypothetical protein